MSLSAQLQKTFPSFSLDVSLSFSGGVLGLLGPSGCGKSMALRCLSGVERPQRGHIALDGTVLFDSQTHVNLPPQRRRVAHVFQSYALFPNMTVEQNLLCAIGRRASDRSARLEALLEQFQLVEVRKLRPGQLSGGEQQRSALARSLASRPALLLLDEPFSALDAHLKNHLQLQLKERLSRFSGSAILVTHDRDEAFLLCDHLAIMDGGRVLISGSCRDVFQNPRVPQAARLTGCKNVLPARKAGTFQVYVPAWNCRLPSAKPVPDDLTAIGVRAHDLVPTMDSGEDVIGVKLTLLSESPFEWNLLFRAEAGGTLHWKVSKQHLQENAVPEIPHAFRLPPERLLLLCEEPKRPAF